MYEQDRDQGRALRPEDDRRVSAAPRREFARRIDCADRRQADAMQAGGRGRGAAMDGRGGARRPD
jgi:hypothetical protein